MDTDQTHLFEIFDYISLKNPYKGIRRDRNHDAQHFRGNHRKQLGFMGRLP